MGEGGNGSVEKGRVGEGEEWENRNYKCLQMTVLPSVSSQRSAVSSQHQRSCPQLLVLLQIQRQNPQKGFVLLSGFVVSLTINPILGRRGFHYTPTEGLHITVISVEARAYVRALGFYASLRDNHEKPLLGRPQYLTKALRVDM